MIIARITMGLGNQMFQYAAALALSLEKNTELKVDVSSYEGYKLRKYELEEYFDIKTPKATAEEIASFRFDNPVKKVWNKLIPSKKIRMLGLPYEEAGLARTALALYDNVSAPHKRQTYQEPHYHFDRNFFNANKDVYLQGYWMSWKYFYKYNAQVREAFTIKKELVRHLDKLVSELQSSNSVSIHIRRTDYRTDPLMKKLKGEIPASYYKKAIEKIQQQSKNVVLYFFSDDIEWVKQNLQFNDLPVHYIDRSITLSAIEDFYLMTQCKYNIIANSTFSWWAAYLNANKNKMVIAPKKWYSDASHYDYKDVYPKDWIIVE
jgi:hypothetical protein